jgi:hypothetical protein
MAIPDWAEIGIPDGYGPERLIYNPPSEMVIAELRSIGEGFSPNRIYIRHRDSLRYEPIKSFEPMVSYESAVTSSSQPTLFYMSNEVTKGERGYSGNWVGLYSFDLLKRTESLIAREGSLSLPMPYNRGWVSRLLGTTEDASELYLTLGMMVENTSPGFHMVNHQLARMVVETKSLHLVSQLKGTFF